MVRLAGKLTDENFVVYENFKILYLGFYQNILGLIIDNIVPIDYFGVIIITR